MQLFLSTVKILSVCWILPPAICAISLLNVKFQFRVMSSKHCLLRSVFSILNYLYIIEACRQVWTVPQLTRCGGAVYYLLLLLLVANTIELLLVNRHVSLVF